MINDTVYQSKSSFNQGYLSNLPDDIQLDKDLQSYFDYSAKYFTNQNSKDELYHAKSGLS